MCDISAWNFVCVNYKILNCVFPIESHNIIYFRSSFLNFGSKARHEFRRQLLQNLDSYRNRKISRYKTMFTRIWLALTIFFTLNRNFKAITIHNRFNITDFFTVLYVCMYVGHRLWDINNTKLVAAFFPKLANVRCFFLIHAL